jgi:hypothetical protein
MYGENYGYRSGLNQDMVRHLHDKVRRILSTACLQRGDLVVDIGSNDGTTLAGYPPEYQLVGIDPTGEKFRQFYRSDIHLIPEFFSPELVTRAFPGRKAKVVTSISMFYDLEDPLQFVQGVESILDDEGIWVFEQSYMPTMLRRNAFDTVCHEHLEFYGLTQIHWLIERSGLKIVDLEFNDINGGSISIVAAKRRSSHQAAHTLVEIVLEHERYSGMGTPRPYLAFMDRINAFRDQLLGFLETARKEGKSVYGLGASTKGNVLLQYCGITPDLLTAIGDVNRDKFGCHTPGTLIPILPESEVLARNPDYLVVLPWHFRAFFEKNEKFHGRNLVFPLPEFEIFVPGR